MDSFMDLHLIHFPKVRSFVCLLSVCVSCVTKLEDTNETLKEKGAGVRGEGFEYDMR